MINVVKFDFKLTDLEMALPILDVASLAADPTLSTALAVFLVPSPILEATHGFGFQLTT